MNIICPTKYGNSTNGIVQSELISIIKKQVKNSDLMRLAGAEYRNMDSIKEFYILLKIKIKKYKELSHRIYRVLLKLFNKKYRIGPLVVIEELDALDNASQEMLRKIFEFEIVDIISTYDDINKITTPIQSRSMNISSLAEIERRLKISNIHK
jgi:hypothetical protein